jgi:hypothetical protein
MKPRCIVAGIYEQNSKHQFHDTEKIRNRIVFLPRRGIERSDSSFRLQREE